MNETLTTNLQLGLEKTNKIFATWNEAQQHWLQDEESNYTRLNEEYECTISALRENDQQLDQVRARKDTQKQHQMMEIEKLMTENKELVKRKEQLEADFCNCKAEEHSISTSLAATKEENEVLRNKMEKSLNDLTHGIKQYMALGLEFQKDHKTSPGRECMKFIFTQIDQYEPLKQCYFLIYVDPNNMYQLVETNPKLEQNKCLALLNQLNLSNDIGSFVVNIRKMFCHVIRR